MYVLYTDESGEATNPADKVTVVAGVAVHEDAVRPLAGAVNGILRRYVGKNQADQFEIHGSPLRGGRKEWAGISRGKRVALAHSLLDTICSWEHEGSETQVLPLVVVIDRAHTETPIEMAYAELLFGFDKTLRKMRRDGNGHNGILVADRGKYERSIAAWVEIARAWKRVPKQENGVFTHLSRRPSLLIRALHG